MKLSNLFYVGALSALALTSCKSNDDNSEWLGSDGVNFTSYIEGLTSRASGSAWDDGDRVGIFMTAGADEFANREYTASAAGNLTPAGQALKWPEGGSASFMAYYPYTASLSGKTYTVNVTDQADPKKIDLLYSNNAADIANGETVNLAFKHQLSQIVINVEKDATIESTNGLAIAISGMDTQASFDLNDGTLTPGGNKGNIAMNVNAEGTQAEAIVIPAADLSGAKMTFTLQGMSFDYDVTGTYEAGTKYTYKATLSVLNGQPTVTMGTATIEDWKDQAGGDINVDFEEGEAPSGEEFVALNAPFADGQDGFTIDDVELGGASYVWKHDAEYHYMKASAYVSGTNHATESWLISPAIDLTKATTATLSFMHVINFDEQGEKEQNQTLWVADASTTDASGAWEQVTITTYPNGMSWDESSSGDIDLSKYAGKNIKIAFKYVSTSAAAATWEVWNIKVVGNPGGGSGTVDPEPDPEPTPGGSDLFISEYAEGSGFNKYIELYNPTDAAIDLSYYTLAMKNYSGSDNYDKPSGEKKVTLEGTLAPKTTIVYQHSDAALNVSNAIAISDEVMNFNGNDPILLYKNDIIIDRLGDETSGVVFGVDVTLRRKTTVTGPSATYDPNQWETFEKGDVSGFGSF